MVWTAVEQKGGCREEGVIPSKAEGGVEESVGWGGRELN